jgi:release factor glutamine methyltransferase
MTVKDWLTQATKQLADASISSARLDALILLEDLLERERSWILAHSEQKLTKEQTNRLNRQIARRTRQIPLAYIRGFTEFYGRRFMVNKYVLEPRPESETMIGLLKILLLPARPVIADVGTGSGAIGITAALEIPRAQVDLYDIDSNCLAVAKHNSVLHELHLHAFKRDLLNRPYRHYDAVLANLPYVPTHWMTSPSIKMEPQLAIDGGSDGLDHYRRLFVQLARQHRPPAFVLTESLPPQHQDLASVASAQKYELRATQDLIQVFSPAL